MMKPTGGFLTWNQGIIPVAQDCELFVLGPANLNPLDGRSKVSRCLIEVSAGTVFANRNGMASYKESYYCLSTLCRPQGSVNFKVLHRSLRLITALNVSEPLRPCYPTGSSPDCKP